MKKLKRGLMPLLGMTSLVVTPVHAWGINDLLLPALQLGIKATGNAISNASTALWDSASGKPSREALLAEKKAFLEVSYQELDATCAEKTQSSLDPAKAVMTDFYESVYYEDFARADSRVAKPLLTVEDFGEAILSSPTLMMKRADIQVKAYQAGVGTIGGMHKSDVRQMLDFAALAAKQTGQPISMNDVSGLNGRGSNVAAASLAALPGGVPEYFRAPVLHDPCVRGYLGKYIEAVQAKHTSLSEPKPDTLAEQSAASAFSMD